MLCARSSQGTGAYDLVNGPLRKAFEGEGRGVSIVAWSGVHVDDSEELFALVGRGPRDVRGSCAFDDPQGCFCEDGMRINAKTRADHSDLLAIYMQKTVRRSEGALQYRQQKKGSVRGGGSTSARKSGTRGSGWSAHSGGNTPASSKPPWR